MRKQILSILFCIILSAVMLSSFVSCDFVGSLFGFNSDDDKDKDDDTDDGPVSTSLVVDAAPVTGARGDDEYVRYSLSLSAGTVYTVVVTPAIYVDGMPTSLYIGTNSECTRENADIAKIDNWGSTESGYTLYPDTNVTYYISIAAEENCTFTIEAVTVTAIPLTFGAAAESGSVSDEGSLLYSFPAVNGTTYIVTVNPVSGQYDGYAGTIGYIGMSTCGGLWNVTTESSLTEMVFTADVTGTYYIGIRGDPAGVYEIDVVIGGTLTLDLTAVDGDNYLFQIFDENGRVTDNLSASGSLISTVETAITVLSGDYYLYIRVDQDFGTSFQYDAGEPGYFDLITITENTTLTLTDGDMTAGVEESVSVTGETSVSDGAYFYCYWYIGENADPFGYGGALGRSSDNTSGTGFEGGAITTNSNAVLVPSPGGGSEAVFNIYAVIDSDRSYTSGGDLLTTGDRIVTELGLDVDGSGTTIATAFSLVP